MSEKHCGCVDGDIQMTAVRAPAWYILMEREEAATGIGAR